MIRSERQTGRSNVARTVTLTHNRRLATGPGQPALFFTPEQIVLGKSPDRM
jgi:hypothetical protein